MNKELYYVGGKVVTIIKDIMNEIIRGTLEEKYGADWFEKLKQHMIEHKQESKGKYNNVDDINSYRQMDPTVCYYIMINDSKYKSDFNFYGDSKTRIKDIKNVRNTIAHSRDDGTLEWNDIIKGINVATEAVKTFSNYYGDTYFTSTLVNHFKNDIKSLETEIEDLRNKQSADTNTKKIKYTIAAIIALLVILIGLSIGNFLKKSDSAVKTTAATKTEMTDSSTSSLSSTVEDSSDKNSSNKVQQTSGNDKKENSNDSVELDFSDNPKVQQLADNFSIGVEKVEFNKKDTVVYVTYNNQCSSDVTLDSVRLDVGSESYQMDWNHGAAHLDKILALKSGVVKVTLPKKMEYSDQVNISFLANLMPGMGFDALELATKKVNIQLQ